MKVSKQTPVSFREINAINLVDYLGALGHHPAKTRGNQYWYLSPLPERFEKSASFKVDRIKNIWYDFGIGEGGTLIDFCIRYHRWTISELLENFSNHQHLTPGVPPSPPMEETKTQLQFTHFTIHPLRSFQLLSYLHERRIDIEVAHLYCRQATYSLGIRDYYAIAFANDQGGYELRNKYFKGGTSPKGVTFINRSAPTLSVFEGFFDFLSYCSIFKNQNTELTNFLILNSISFLNKRRALMEGHQKIRLFLDNDRAGDIGTKEAMSWGRKYIDHRPLFMPYKDLNDWIGVIGKGHARKP